MKTHDICCIGHITLDKIVTPKNTVHMPGGTAFYFSQAVKRFQDIDYALVTSVGKNEMNVVEEMRSESMNITILPSKYSVCFENIYGENQDNRTQKVLARADPFTPDKLQSIHARIYHLGTLLADDFSLDVIKYLSRKGLISVDSQGYLREVKDTHVYPVDWKDKREALKYIHFLKVNEHEMEILTGYQDIAKAAIRLAEWGVKEVIITLGSMGSVIYDNQGFHTIPAYRPNNIEDATGCGDTYITGYLYRRAKNTGVDEAGRFAAAMATLKIEHSGPFNGTKEDIYHCMKTRAQKYPVL